MATTAELAPDAGEARKSRKAATPFGGGIPIGLIGLIATVIGFTPTFFSRLGDTDAVHHAHGWTMTGWVVLVLAQAILIRSRRYKWHRILGWSSLALFVAMVATSWQVVALMMSGTTGLPFEAAKFFGYSDIVNMPLLIFCFGGAIYWRKNRHLHSRLMAVTVLTSIVPALARMFNILIWRTFEGLYNSMHLTYLLILAVLAIAIFRDVRSANLRWPLPLAFVWISAVYATQWPMMNAAWYDGFARWLGTLG